MPQPAFVFDLDGTLVDTAPDLLDALNFVLLREGRRALGIEDLRHLVGHGPLAMLAEGMKRTGAPVDPDRLPALFEAFIGHYRTHIARASRPYPGVPETLAKLKDQGARLGVLTNKPQDLTDLLLPALGLKKFFHAIHGAGRLEVVKPDARVFHHVLEEMGAESGALMIGDSATDVATARAAAVPVIILAYGYSATPVSSLGADRVTDDFTELPRLAGELLA